jgi:hypothetical protein
LFIIISGSIKAQSNFIQIGAKGNDGIHDLAVYDDEIYITGYFQGVLNKIKAKGDTDAFIAKIDMDKEFVWMNSLGSDYRSNSEITEYGKYIIVDNSKNSYVLGLFYKEITGDNTEKKKSKGKQDIFLAKYASSGNTLWVATFGTENSDGINGLFIDDDYLFIIADYGVEKDYKNNRNCILKFDINGKKIWQKNIIFEASSNYKILETKKVHENFYFLVKTPSEKYILKYNLNEDTFLVGELFTWWWFWCWI